MTLSLYQEGALFALGLLVSLAIEFSRRPWN